MSCSNRIWFTLLMVGILFAAAGNALLPAPLGSQLLLLGFLCILIMLLGKLTPWVMFYKDNHEGRTSRRVIDHPERLPLVSTFPNGDFLIAVNDRRYRMWKGEVGEVYCQEIDIKSGHKIGNRIASASGASAFGIPAEIYRRLEKSMKMENKFL